MTLRILELRLDFITCCAEMDIWEANSMATTYTPTHVTLVLIRIPNTSVLNSSSKNKEKKMD